MRNLQGDKEAALKIIKSVDGQFLWSLYTTLPPSSFLYFSLSAFLSSLNKYQLNKCCTLSTLLRTEYAVVKKKGDLYSSGPYRLMISSRHRLRLCFKVYHTGAKVRIHRRPTKKRKSPDLPWHILLVLEPGYSSQIS